MQQQLEEIQQKHKARALRFGIQEVAANPETYFPQLSNSSIDINSQSEQLKRKLRLERFGKILQSTKPQRNWENRIEVKEGSEIRRDCLLLFGIDFLTAADIKKYLENYEISNIEWLNDSNCIVQFISEQDCLQAFNEKIQEGKVEQAMDLNVIKFHDIISYKAKGRLQSMQARFAVTTDVKTSTKTYSRYKK